MNTTADEIAQTILDGFDKHYRLFRDISAGARARFENSDWSAVQAANIERIQMYDRRVGEAVDSVKLRFQTAAEDNTLWPLIKRAYITLLHNHKQPECAETFYNSVACRVLHRSYYHNDFLFWRPAVSTDHIEGDDPTYNSYYPSKVGLRRSLLKLLNDIGFTLPFENLRRDLRYLLRALQEQFPQPQQVQPNYQIQVLSSPFYRNKAAYLIGRAINGSWEQPFVIPLLQNERGELFVDALLMESKDILRLFSFARAYFMVDMEIPSAYVSFLRFLMPNKAVTELYTLLGLQKHGKTLFFRDLQHHLKHSTDNFMTAPGIKGMVMLVFTLPSFPYVFKVIKDRFEPPKDVNRETVKAKYLLVKYHDRVGRLADTLEYSEVALPLERIEPELMQELQERAAQNIEFDGDYLIIKHLYIERRMIPLNIYLREADDDKRRYAIREYGDAIRDLAAANIFPGDMLLKNFGVTRHGRIVFYDYDEICYLTECNFRRIPPPPSWQDEMSDQVWYSAGPHDVFPEQFGSFAFPVKKDRDLFLRDHSALLDADFWFDKQQRIHNAQQDDIFPYAEEQRFRYRFVSRSGLAKAA
jgi:isocitrate dehydrogenase kinase/phosphatase